MTTTLAMSGIPTLDKHNPHVAWLGNMAVPGTFAGKRIRITIEVASDDAVVSTADTSEMLRGEQG